MATVAKGKVLLPGASFEDSAMRGTQTFMRLDTSDSIRGSAQAKRHLSVLGELTTTNWLAPERPVGLELHCHGVDREVGERVYEASIEGDATAIAGALGVTEDGVCTNVHEGVANWHVSDVYGIGPLMVAARAGHLEAVAALLDAGADVDAKVIGLGETALHRAAGAGRLAVVDLLIQRGASANAEADDGSIPLHSAAKRGHGQVAKALCGAGGAFDHADLLGGTPLMRAADSGFVEVRSSPCFLHRCRHRYRRRTWATPMRARA